MLPQRPSGHIALLTDFGHRDPYVGVMKGAILRTSPKVVVVDLAHDVPPQDVATGALFLASALGHFPAGTVFVAVVDPGVGTDRRLLAAAAHDAYWLGPDNGLLDGVLASDAQAEVRALDLAHLGIALQSMTFHGRDVLAPVAAWLAGGRYGFSALGPRVQDWVRLPTTNGQQVVHVDHFGNLITNVAAKALVGVREVVVGDQRIAVRGTYGEAAPGELLALVGSTGVLEIAVRDGSAAQRLGLARGAKIALG